MNYAIVHNGIVINTIVWDQSTQWSPPAGTVAVIIPEGAYVGVGSTYDGSSFGEPPQTSTGA
ncbi:hypothetical protein [Burkholderia multivorans]|uniref:hypothetical protein n=1 Tax=Burkholderia multivorans TaxID=87883 RepID=UPI000CFF70CF|nr:hypothetical protein [Burkholderia multivorans]PRF91662.1 hypothetical protein C6Q23_10035 [Burkholderia multivorans]